MISAPFIHETAPGPAASQCRECYIFTPLRRWRAVSDPANMRIPCRLPMSSLNDYETPMRAEGPDTSRQSEGFEAVHTGLTAGQISVRRSDFRKCLTSESVTAIRARNVNPAYDYLPVEDGDGNLIGLLSSRQISDTSNDSGAESVVDLMDPLSEADLIGAGTPISVLIGRIRLKPFLVVSGPKIFGMVAWSDLQKLPVRAALFALVTGFELTMYEAIRRHFGTADSWTEHLDECRLCMAKKQYRQRRERDSDVDLLLCTQFCDKRDILIKSFEFDIGKKKLRKKLKAIERVRDDVAHANNYAMTFNRAEKLRETLADLGDLRGRIHSLAR